MSKRSWVSQYRWMLIALLASCDDCSCDCGNDGNTNDQSQSKLTLTVMVGPHGRATVGYGDPCVGPSTCAYDLNRGETTPLVPVADEGYELDQVEGLGCEQGTVQLLNVALQCSFTFQPAVRHTMTVVVNGPGHVENNPAGAIDCPEDCTAAYGEEEVTLDAITDEHFLGWSGEGCSTTSPEVAVFMDRERTCTATFVANVVTLHTLMVSVSGMGMVRSEPSELVDCGERCTGDVPEGTAVTLVATPAAGWRFVSWSDACVETTGPESQFTMDADVTCGATFEQIAGTTHQVTVATDGGLGRVTSDPAGVDCGMACTASFAQGSMVTLTATPAEGYELIGWSGSPGCDSTAAATVTFTVDGDKGCTASFRPRFLLNVLRAGNGQGVVTSIPDGLISCGSMCAARFAGGTATLVATAQTSSHFVGWTGDCVAAGTNQATVAMTANRTCIATFGLPNTLTIQKTGSGSGRVTTLPPSALDCGTTCSAQLTGTITVLAMPDTGSVFNGWSGDCRGTASTELATGTVVMDQSRTCSVSFLGGLPMTCHADLQVSQDGFFVIFQGASSTGGGQQITFEWDYSWTSGLDVGPGPDYMVIFEDIRTLPAGPKTVSLTVRSVDGCVSTATAAVPGSGTPSAR
jgi:hypothetical protein